MIRILQLISLLIVPCVALQAQSPTAQQKQQCNAIVNTAQKFPDPDKQRQFRAILRITRCVKCPNQSLESSQAGLANDLRIRICLNVLQNKTTPQIIDDLVARYGDYILYDPRFTPSNYLLWLTPVALLLLGLMILFINIRSRQQKHAAYTIDPEQAHKLERLLAQDNEEHRRK